MSFREATLKIAGLPDKAIQFALNAEQHKCCSVAPLSSNILHSFPPAFIPIWRETGSTSMLGVWKNWFSDRPDSYVRISPTNDYRIREFARSFDQLVVVILLQEICASEGITGDIEDFARKNGVENLEEIDEVSLNTGDDLTGLTALFLFKDETPLEVISDMASYDGFFPIEQNKFNTAKHSSLEYTSSAMEEMLAKGNVPLWLRDREPVDEFERLIEKGLLNEAWQVLNSNGWTFSQAKTALKKLINKSDNKNFEQAANDWLSLPHNELEGY